MQQTFRGPRDNVHVYENNVIGTTIPSVWLYGGAHYWQTKGWLRRHVLRWCLDGVWLWAACLISRTSVASPLESADALPSLSPRVRHPCPPSGAWRRVSRQVFQWKRTPADTERASPVSHTVSDITRDERGWSQQRVWRERCVQLVYSSVTPAQQPEIPRYSRVRVSCPHFCQTLGIHTHTRKTQQKDFHYFTKTDDGVISQKITITGPTTLSVLLVSTKVNWESWTPSKCKHLNKILMSASLQTSQNGN